MANGLPAKLIKFGLMHEMKENALLVSLHVLCNTKSVPFCLLYGLQISVSH